MITRNTAVVIASMGVAAAAAATAAPQETIPTAVGEQYDQQQQMPHIMYCSDDSLNDDTQACAKKESAMVAPSAYVKGFSMIPTLTILPIMLTVLAIGLFTYIFWLFTSRRYSWRRFNKRRKSLRSKKGEMEVALNNDNEYYNHDDSMTNIGEDYDESIGNDQEQAEFEELYTSTIQYSKYSALVLPPKCYRIPNYKPPVVAVGTNSSRSSNITASTSTASSLVSSSFRLFHSNNMNNINNINNSSTDSKDKVTQHQQQQQQKLHTEEKEEKMDDCHNLPRVGLLYTIPHSPIDLEQKQDDVVQQQHNNDQLHRPEIPHITITAGTKDLITTPTTKVQHQQQLLLPRTTTTDDNKSLTLLMEQEQQQEQQQQQQTEIIPTELDATACCVPDKHGYMNIGDVHLHNTKCTTPLLVFVNSRSGSQQGYILIQQLRQLLNPIQIWDLSNAAVEDDDYSGCDGGDPYTILESFVPAFIQYKLRILVCGGDGTVAWIIHTLERLMSTLNGNDATTTTTTTTTKRSASSQQVHTPTNIISYPPIAILPLGTGNDLSRILGWGGGYNNESLIVILEQIAKGYISLLDRWEVSIHENTGSITTSALSTSATISSKVKKSSIKNRSISSGNQAGVTKTKGFFNYLGVGADAQAALQVHNLREIRPQWFFSRIINKAMYGIFGAEDIIKATTVHVRHDIQLIADGVVIPLPHDSQGIILLNIDSYAGGVPLWSHGISPPVSSFSSSLSDLHIKNDTVRRNRLHKRFASENELSRFFPKQRSQSNTDRNDNDTMALRSDFTDEERYKLITACNMPTSCQDGYLDIVSIRGAFHLGQIKVGLSNAQRLCQAREVTINIRNKVAIQVDGEPWRQNACTIHIRRKQEPAVMLHRSIDDGGVEMEMSKLLDWAETRNIIDHQVHTILMKEFSRRIESRTRERREAASAHRQSHDHFLQITSTIKKAISSGAMFDP